jgi:hypothetical protein
MIRVDVIRAWPHRFDAVTLELAEGATLRDALAASGFPLDDITGFAVFGERETLEYRLREGDRVELLRPLQADPKEARRRRASSARAPK